MHRLVIEVDAKLYRQLAYAAQANQVSLEDECLRRLQGQVLHSRYMQALLAELRADEEQRRATEGDRVV
ncbi:hypothetical protein ACQKPE_14120 [Pseudomonas sp. NPDC089554]|uniref:hypothetical protein n=1 Tax=Pseudomonas sp. NPDC089554 TaxID=3390653 RepID=UPI003D045ABF